MTGGVARSIVVVTGASGTGKTATVTSLDARALPGVRCFHFDSIGVPSMEVMERDFGGPERWQARATNEWLARLAALDDDVRIAVLDGQTRPSTVFAAAGAVGSSHLHVVLFDCSPDVREARLRGPRGQPELATARMDSWAAYLRGQADALGLPIVDTTTLTIAEATDQLEELVLTLRSRASEVPLSGGSRFLDGGPPALRSE
jgi:hypothetical protein